MAMVRHIFSLYGFICKLLPWKSAVHVQFCMLAQVQVMVMPWGSFQGYRLSVNKGTDLRQMDGQV